MSSARRRRACREGACPRPPRGGSARAGSSLGPSACRSRSRPPVAKGRSYCVIWYPSEGPDRSSSSARSRDSAVDRRARPRARAEGRASRPPVQDGEGARESRDRSGQVAELGGAPTVTGQAQKILDRVWSWAWTSSPMTGKTRVVSMFRRTTPMNFSRIRDSRSGLRGSRSSSRLARPERRPRIGCVTEWHEETVGGVLTVAVPRTSRRPHRRVLRARARAAGDASPTAFLARRLAAALGLPGIPIVRATQVHGTAAVTVAEVPRRGRAVRRRRVRRRSRPTGRASRSSSRPPTASRSSSPPAGPSARPTRAGAARRAAWPARRSRALAALGARPGRAPRVARSLDRALLLRGRRRGRGAVRRGLRAAGCAGRYRLDLRGGQPRSTGGGGDSRRPHLGPPRLHDVRRREVRQLPPRRRHRGADDRLVARLSDRPGLGLRRRQVRVARDELLLAGAVEVDRQPGLLPAPLLRSG